MTQALAPRPAQPRRIVGTLRLEGPSLGWMRFTVAVIATVPLAGLALALWSLWGRGLSGLDLGLFLGFYAVSGLGIAAGFHRLFAHKAFSAPTPVRVAFAVAGSLALQGSLISWVATHRRHHAYSDAEGDPHSPHLAAEDGLRGTLRGLAHAHMGWLFDPEKTESRRWAPDLMKEPAMAAVDRAFGWIVLASFTLPAIIGFAVTRSLWGAATAFLWGSLARMFLLHHVTWSINSVCHFFGSRPYDSKDEARNNWPLSLISFGESWHNTHHAFPSSAVHGLRWYQVDLAGLLIKSLRRVGLVRDVRVPEPAQLAARRR